MKYCSLVLVAFVVFIFLSVVDAQITFERWYGGPGTDIGYSVAQTADGGYIIAGRTGSFGAGSYDVYLVKTDSLGDTIWTKTYGGSDWDSGLSVTPTFSGGYVVSGFTESFAPIGIDVYLIKVNSVGDTVWTKTYGGTDGDVGYSVEQTPDSGYIIAGDTYCLNSGSWSWDIYLIKIDSSGDTNWTKTYGGTDDDYGRSVALTFDGGYIIAGMTKSFGAGSYDVYLVKTDSLGDTIWTKTYGDSGDEQSRSIAQCTDGGYIIAGGIAPFGAEDLNVYLIRTDSNGDTLWTKTYGGSGNEQGKSVVQTFDGGYIITGVTTSFGSGGYDVYLIKTDSLGDTIWTKTYGGTNGDVGYSVVQTFDKGYIVAGLTDSFGAGIIDIYLVKTDSCGNVAGIKKEKDKKHKTTDISLLCYPNPFSSFTTLVLTLPGAQEHKSTGVQDIELKIYDVTGKLVKDFSLGTDHSALTTAVSWNGRDSSERPVPTGIYFCRLNISGHKPIARKVTIIR